MGKSIIIRLGLGRSRSGKILDKDTQWFTDKNKAIEKSFYKRFLPKDVQDTIKEVDKLNFDIARKTMIKEGFENENK